MLKGNKGEWSEVYVLLRLLADRKLYAADEYLNKLDNIFFPIVKIIREEFQNEKTEFIVEKVIKIFINGTETISVPTSVFNSEANSLLKNILDKKGKSAFSVERTENFMNSINCFILSAPSTNKSDITMKIHDINTGYSPTVGFSIKSELGNPPTLLNAGKSTNFIFKLQHGNEQLIKETNNIYRISKDKKHIDLKGRISNIINHNGNLMYYDMANSTFKDNLVLLDSNMDKIIAETLLYFYRDGIINCTDIVNQLEKNNPMNFGNLHAYSYKFKKFLTSVALGMKPATIWDGVDEATGGYIIVTREGEVLAYHIYNRNYFEEYLLRNTKYETASTSRHDFGKVYQLGKESFINLNLQVRFIK